jgi:hypothetical protein
LGLPIGLLKPTAENFLPIVMRIEKRITSTSNFLTLACRFEMVNSVLYSLPTYFMSVVEMPPSIRHQIDIYRKHCLWRGADLNAKKPPLVAWQQGQKKKVVLAL